MSEISLEQYYDLIEQTTNSLDMDDSSVKLLRELKQSDIDDAIKRKVHIEQLVSDFSLAEGKCNPQFSGPSKNGGIVEYPSYIEFTEVDFQYLRDRSSKVKNNMLKGRYHQILWNSPIKNFSDAKASIDSYLIKLSLIDNSKKEKNSVQELNIFMNAFTLSLNVNYKVSEFKEIYKKWIFENDSFDSEMRIHLIRELVDLSQLKKSDFEGVLDVLLNHGLDTPNHKDSSWPLYVYETGLLLAQKKVRSETKSWNELIGDSYVKMAEARMNDDTKMVPLDFYRKAISYYKAAGAKIKVEETEQKFSELKKNLKLSKVSIPFDDDQNEKFNKLIVQTSEKILSLEPEGIYSYLIAGGEIFPSKEQILKASNNGQNSIFNFLTKIEFDINNNISKVGDESEKDAFFKQYGFYMQMALPLLHRVFFEGIKRNKISYETLSNFISQNSWLGKTLKNTNSAGDVQEYNWIQLIAPSFYYYFLQAEITTKVEYIETNYVMPIDSLSMKLEGMIRDIAKLLKISTVTTTRENNFREKYIEELIADEDLAKTLGDNDVVFLQYFFTKNGMNIRNNIAHAFYKSHNYGDILMPILICAILKIGKFQFINQSKEQS